MGKLFKFNGVRYVTKRYEKIIEAESLEKAEDILDQIDDKAMLEDFEYYDYDEHVVLVDMDAS